MNHANFLVLTQDKVLHAYWDPLMLIAQAYENRGEPIVVYEAVVGMTLRYAPTTIETVRAEMALRKDRKMCADCKEPPTVHFGFVSRCDRHALRFQVELRKEKERRADAERLALLEHKAAGCPDDGVVCSECCEHTETDHGICMDCEADCTDDLVGRAEAAFEGDR